MELCEARDFGVAHCTSGDLSSADEAARSSAALAELAIRLRLVDRKPFIFFDF